METAKGVLTMKIEFIDNEHEKTYYMFCEMFGDKLEEYRYTIAYLLALDGVCRVHYKDLFDFDECVIKPEGLNEPWQTGSSMKTTRLMFNLWNGYCGEPQENQSNLYTPEELFSCGYARYYLQAIKLRFPWYTEE